MACKPCRPCKQNPALSQWWLWGLAGVSGAVALWLFTRKPKHSKLVQVYTPEELQQIKQAMQDVKRAWQKDQVEPLLVPEHTNATKKDPLSDPDYAERVKNDREFFLSDTWPANFMSALSPEAKKELQEEIYATRPEWRKARFQNMNPDAGGQKAILVMANEPGQWVETFWPEIQSGTAPAIILGLALAISAQAKAAAKLGSIKPKQAGADEGAWNNWSDDKRLAVIRSMSVG